MAAQSSQRRYVAILAAISAGILIVGSRFRPEEVPEVSLTQAEMVRLQSMAQRQNLERLTDYFAQMADDVKSGVVWIDGLDSSGVVWGAEGLVVTASPGTLPDGEISTLIPGERVPLETEVMSPLFPVVTLRAPESRELRPVFQSVADNLDPGEWIFHVASTREGRHLHTPGNYEGVVQARCGGLEVRTVKTNLPLARTALGGGIFDLDRNLLGLVVQCEDGILAVTPGDVEALIQAATSLEGQLVRRYGFRVRSLDDRARTYFREQMGVMVTEICVRMPAEMAGLEPGDVIQALDDAPVNGTEDLARLVLPVAFPVFHLYVKRGGKVRRLDIEATAADYKASKSGAPQGIVVDASADGVGISNVAPGSPAASASIEPGDRLLSIDGKRQKEAADVEAALRNHPGGDVFVVVRRGKRKLGIFLQ